MIVGGNLTMLFFPAPSDDALVWEDQAHYYCPNGGIGVSVALNEPYII